MRSGLSRTEIEGNVHELVEALFVNIPSGVGSHRKDLKLNREEQRQVLRKGARWAVERGYGDSSDLEHIEAEGCLNGADPEEVSERAMERGRDQLGTVGSGNHFVEVGYVAEVFDEKVSQALGLWKNQVTVFVHTGSRGLGHQVCDDYIRVMMDAARKYRIELPDPQLCCAPVSSAEGERYFRAMASAANFAFANRQMISHWVRETFEQVLGMAPKDLKLGLVYDVCHNIAKIETHTIKGERRKVCVHRKGATRAFPPGHPEIPERYRSVGQPVLIPGDMGRYSYVAVGTETAMRETFGSTCHGAGRMMSRAWAKRLLKGKDVLNSLEERGITVMVTSVGDLAEEASEAYKDVAEVVEVAHGVGISRKVARSRPIGVVKG